MDEMLEVMDGLWRGKLFSYEGEYYRFPDLQMSPELFHPLPIYVGGQSPAAYARAARHDGYVGGQVNIEDLPTIIEGLQQAREREGQTMENFEIVVCLYRNSAENFERCRELGVTQIYKEAFCDENGMASTMPLDAKLDDMERFAEAYMA